MAKSREDDASLNEHSDYRPEDTNECTATTLYQACARNEPLLLQKVLERGVLKEEVMELDTHGCNGLMLACSKGFMDIVCGLCNCPFLDINHQDNEGNTALMIVSQAGYVIMTTYLLNYFPGIDTEIRDHRGFTALIKSAMTGCNDVVAALVMAGADLHAVDSRKGKCAQTWALRTSRYSTVRLLRHLNMHLQADQFCESYIPEWPELNERVKRRARDKVTKQIRQTFAFRNQVEPEDGCLECCCLDHMVRRTTSVHSVHLICSTCRPLCLTSWLKVGKKRLTVSKLIEKYSMMQLEDGPVYHRSRSASHTGACLQPVESNSTACCAETDWRGSRLSVASTTDKFLPYSPWRRNTMFRYPSIPTISITRTPECTPEKKKKLKKKVDKGFLVPPKWNYKKSREERKKKEKKK